MSTCNHCGRYTDNSKLGEDCRYCKEVYAQGLADGERRERADAIAFLRTASGNPLPRPGTNAIHAMYDVADAFERGEHRKKKE